MKEKLMTVLLMLAAIGTYGQGYVDQKAMADVFQLQGMGKAPEPVQWHLYTFPKSAKTAKARLVALQHHIDSLPGTMGTNRLGVVELSNRATKGYFAQKTQLAVPNVFPDDFRAYSPYPAYWREAESLPKIFVIDKYTQTFGAYEGGNLVRWGLVSSGKDATETPGGRFAFGWKQETRNSSEAPEGETWQLRWVYNFFPQRGIHVHQYSLPVAQAVSHGCVRMSETEAKWNYSWADKGTPVLVINGNPYGLASHWDLSGDGAFSKVILPFDPMGVPDGTKSVAMY
ncbi:MAG: L,D-transpeptidase [Sphingobacteriales bacterium]|nr:MAG: L,D-transpeptidase [Sphingobacteriales bacterium]